MLTDASKSTCSVRWKRFVGRIFLRQVCQLYVSMEGFTPTAYAWRDEVQWRTAHSSLGYRTLNEFAEVPKSSTMTG